MATHAVRNELVAWLKSLTQTGRLIVLLHYAEGLADAETAEILGLAETTVAGQLRAARRAVKGIYEKHAR
jgi:DNA-directed RNA polymerase specialized sigma24 family protein